MTNQEIADRRQRAREAAQDVEADSPNDPMSGLRAVEAAIETATRVQITPELLRIAGAIECGRPACDSCVTGTLRAVFAAAGFEVQP